MKARPLSNLKLRDQVLVAYIILLVIPMIITGFLLFFWSSSIVEDQTRTILSQTLEQAELHISYAVHEIRSLAEILYENQEVQRVLKRKVASGYNEYEEYLFLDEIVRRIEDTPRVFRVRLFVPDEKIYAREGSSFFPLSDVADFGPGNPYWTRESVTARDNPTEYQSLRYVLPIKDFNDFDNIIGCLYIDLLISEMEDILSKISFQTRKGYAFIVGPDGLIAAGEELPPELITEITDIMKPLLAREDPDTVANLTFSGTGYAVLSRRISGIPWFIVNFVPRAEILHANFMVARITAIIIGFFSALAALAAVLVANRITARIHLLIERMESLREIYDRTESIDEGVYARDEMGLLQTNFDRMVKRIRQLIDENYVAALQKREAELHALQAQINPHFLYNVLESINWLALKEGARKISRMVTCLGRFYRLGLSKGRDVITVGEEIDYVKAYLDIQKIRFGDSVTVEFDVPERILDSPIVKLTLQPLVENAINHGLLTKNDRSGVIRIEGLVCKGDILIKVKDDGMGVNFDKVNYLLSDTSGRSKRGFGIKNVDERLKLHFGDAFGLRVVREENRWTVAEIRLPAVLNGEPENPTDVEVH